MELGFINRSSEGSSLKKRRISGFFQFRSLDDAHSLIRLGSDQAYTVGRSKRRCEIVLQGRCISRLHCQIFLDPATHELRLVDCSLNGVFVNGRRLHNGIIAELSVGDEVFLGCHKGSKCSGRIGHGFVVDSIVFSEPSSPTRAAHLLLSHCRRILQLDDPISYLRFSLDLDTKQHLNTGVAMGISDQNVLQNNDPKEKIERLGCYSDGRTFFLNRLEHIKDQHTGVTLPELLHPVESLVRVFIATFTCDVAWFLSCCQVPNHLPVTIACHNAERCWSFRPESRTLAPYSDYPNLLLVFPPFPDVIAFGKDRKKQGVACHHPKLIVLQREDSIRVVVTSANLNSKQWNQVTNTIWWQDFPLGNDPDYSALFATFENSNSDFAAQLAGFVATLITDVPSQAHWIPELIKFDFNGAVVHLVASIPGMHTQDPHYSGVVRCSSVMQSQSCEMKFLGSVSASVVGLSHRFRTMIDSNGTQMKSLASILGKCRENTTGILEVLLKRNTNIPADANAVSILVADLDEFSEGDCVQLGFLPREVAKWVSPLSDVGFFSFSAFIYPKEAIAAAYSGTNMKVQLLLHVAQGKKFSEISRLIQPEHIAPLCTLLASIQRCVGLWRLEEVLTRYNWPEQSETDFLYGSSAIGTSVNAQFFASFSAAAGKRSSKFSESEESDPEWGCWTIVHEFQKPSLRILFPTIERVMTGACGIQSYRRLLSFSEKTWQRMRYTGVFHDAIPHPVNRVGYPMHVKIARRRFQSKTGGSSFGWIYCGSHNFSAAAWGLASSSELTRLRICNYELGIVLIVPPSSALDLDDIALPFVTSAAQYKDNDKPATKQAIHEVFIAAAVAATATATAAAAAAAAVAAADDDEEDIHQDVPDDEDEMLIEAAESYISQEKEEEKIYAETLWSQVDSSDG